jgi:hypothetical protein
MKWETVTSTLGHSVYALWNNGRKLVTLAFNFSSHSVRIEYADEKRVFFIRKEGFLKNKTVLRNEYGVRMGYAGSENNESYIMVDNERFFYSLDDNKEPAVTIYKESKDQPLAVCSLEKPRIGKLVRDDAHYSLLLTLCWYLFHPSKQQARQLQYA